MGRSLVLVVTMVGLVVGVASAAPADAGAPANAVRVERLDAYVRDAMRAWEVPGLSVAIVDGDREPLVRAWGVRELGRPERMDPDTVFTIASVSKSFTAAALGLLVHEDRLAWETPVLDVLPYFRMPESDLTPRVNVVDLLAHRAGLDDPQHVGWAGLTRRELIERVRHYETPVHFRDRLTYSNVGYTAAGELIPALTGRSWDEFVTERLLRPLGMHASSTTAAALHGAKNRSLSHVRRADGTLVLDPFVADGWWTNDFRAASAGLNATTRDMVRWLQALANRGRVDGRQVLPAEVVDRMMEPGILTEPDLPGAALAGYALGLVVQEYGGQRTVSHSGLFRGHGGRLIVLPERRLGVYVFLNSRDAASGLDLGLALWILDRLLGRPAVDWSARFRAEHERALATRRAARDAFDARRTLGTQPSLDREAYLGTYRHPAWGDWAVEQRDGALWLTSLAAKAPVAARLEHWERDTFRPAWNDPVDDYHVAERVTFRLDALGRVDALRFENVADPYWGTIEFRRETAAGDAQRP